jgi:hypothetical protein
LIAPSKPRVSTLAQELKCVAAADDDELGVREVCARLHDLEIETESVK